MKKIIISIGIILISIVAVLFLKDPNIKLEMHEFTAKFKPTVYLNYSSDIDEVYISGVIDSKHSDDGKGSYTNKEKTEKIVKVFNKTQFVEVKRLELPNMSPDVFISLKKGGNIEQKICLYGQVLLEDCNTGKIYRSKKNIFLIDEIEKILQ